MAKTMIGKPWGATRYRTPEGVEVSLYRGPGNRARWYTDAGEQVGSEQRNVVPAIVYAFAQGWWDTAAPDWLNIGAIAEVRRNTTHRRARA